MIESLKTGQWLTPARLRTYPILLLVMLGGALAFLIVTGSGNHDRFGRPLGPDFSEIWAAGQEVREGQPEKAYDIAAHKAKQAELFGPSADFYLWSYPPYFLGIAGLLACFPYIFALLIWQAATLSLYLAAILAILRPTGFSRLCFGPAPKPSSDTENALTLTFGMWPPKRSLSGRIARVAPPHTRPAAPWSAPDRCRRRAP